jgi:hypothetical protein
MKNTFVFGVALYAIGCASSQHKSTMPSQEEAKSLDAYVRDVFDHIGHGDYAYLKKSVCPEAVVFDIDEHGAPIAARGKAEVDRLIDHYAQLSKASAAPSANITRLECRSLGGSGVCAIEFDQSMSANGRTMGPVPVKLRATLVAERHNERWIWVHWHGSMRQAPQVAQTAPPAASMPAPAAAAPAPAAPAAATPAP